jgi:hypothetical protein
VDEFDNGSVRKVEFAPKRSLTRQADAGSVAINELDASRLARATNGSQVVDRRNPAAFLKVADRALAQVRPDSQFGLRPVGWQPRAADST